MGDPILAYGLALAEAGYHIFPANRTTKEPQRGVLWTRVSSRDRGTIEAWAARYGNERDALAWGVDCGKSGVVAVDVDPGGEWPEAGPYRTPRGGTHVFYQDQPVDGRAVIGNDNTGKLGPALDVKGLGGYVVAYGPGAPAAVFALAPVPARVVEAMRRPPSGGTAAGGTAAGGTAGLAAGAVGTVPEIGVGPAGPAAGFSGPERLFTYEQAVAFCKPLLDVMGGTVVGAGLNSAINTAALALGHFVPAAGTGAAGEAEGAGAFWSAADAESWILQALAVKYQRDGIERTERGDEQDRKAVRSGLNAASWKAERVADAEVRKVSEVPLGDDAVALMLAEMLDTDGLDAIDNLEPVVRGWLWKNTIARINGKSTHGKSFVALDIAGHVGSGMTWRDGKTAQGVVVYAVAEGAQGFRKRVRAWERYHGMRMAGVRFLPRPIQVTGAEWTTFTEACRQIAPVLIILDTQARVTVGVDENDNTEMGRVVHQADELRRATGACVTFVHHLGHQGEEGRGATAVKAALQTEILVRREGRTVTVVNPKQKDDSDDGELNFDMHIVETGRDDEGMSITSCVLVVPGSALAPIVKEDRAQHWEDLATDAATFLVGLFEREFSEGAGGTQAQVRAVAMETYKMSKSTFYWAWNRLEGRGVIARVAGLQRYKIVPIEDRMSESNGLSNG